jgi:hypothetical protein
LRSAAGKRRFERSIAAGKRLRGAEARHRILLIAERGRYRIQQYPVIVSLA